MISPLVHVIYLCFLKQTNGFVINFNSNKGKPSIGFDSIYAIKYFAANKRTECKMNFFLEGELAWGRLSVNDINNFISKYYGRKNG